VEKIRIWRWHGSASDASMNTRSVAFDGAELDGALAELSLAPDRTLFSQLARA
jgi:hypothetical protein